jgi:hypothetical protein
VAPTLRATLADALLWDSFRDFLALGIPGGFMMQLEGNSYDITTLLAGLLGRVSPPCMFFLPVQQLCAACTVQRGQVCNNLPAWGVATSYGLTSEGQDEGGILQLGRRGLRLSLMP